jgi:hypothetical protein
VWDMIQDRWRCRRRLNSWLPPNQQFVPGTRCTGEIVTVQHSRKNDWRTF